jgi:serine/threonine protein kinase
MENITIKKIAEGSYGSIYLDETRNMIYKCSKNRDHCLDASFVREIFFLSKLNASGSAVCFHGIEHQNKNHFIVMEKMDCNLKEFCHEICSVYKNIVIKNYSESHVNEHIYQRFLIMKKIFYKILYCVNEFKKNSILHNDIKPLNILVNYRKYPLNEKGYPVDFELKLCDFGLTTLIGKSMENVSCIGTSKYSAPEMKNNSVKKFYEGVVHNDHYDQNPMMDMYSVGVVMTHVLCYFIEMKTPDIVTVSILQNIMNFIPSPLKNDHLNEFHEILCVILQENPQKRYDPIQCLRCSYFDGTEFVINNKKVPNECITYSKKIKNIRQLFEKFHEKITNYVNCDYIAHDIIWNIFYIFIQLMLFNSQMSITNMKVSIFWGLCVYHHKQLHVFKQNVKDLSHFRKNENQLREHLPNIQLLNFESNNTSINLQLIENSLK